MLDRQEMVRVKVLSREPQRILSRQLPGTTQRWGRCQFLFDPDERDYDWVLAYNDLPGRRKDPAQLQQEHLACPQRQTLLVTTEPSSIKTYGNDFTAQFGCVLTSQEDWALPHRDRIYSQPALHWFYGVGEDHALSYDELAAMKPMNKSRDLAMVWSGKQGKHTDHARRYEFMVKLREALPGLDVFGRGVRALDDKREALDDFRYHIAIENHRGLHHWTEKLADPFLGYCLPFYWGCPNASEYCPEESFIAIDISKFDQALECIVESIRSGEYQRRLPFIEEARKRVLTQYNLFAVAAREIEARLPLSESGPAGMLLSRHEIRRRSPRVAVKQVLEKMRVRALTALKKR